MEEKWIKVYELDNYQINTTIWLEELLKADNIPYKNEIEEYWIGTKIPKYTKRLKVFIPQKYENIVKKYIEEYENSKLEESKNIEELKNIDDNENDIEVERYNKIRKNFFRGYMFFLILIFAIIICTIIVNHVK